LSIARMMKSKYLIFCSRLLRSKLISNNKTPRRLSTESYSDVDVELKQYQIKKAEEFLANLSPEQIVRKRETETWIENLRWEGGHVSTKP